MSSVVRCRTVVLAMAAGTLSACTSGGLFERRGAERLTVQRLPPLSVPPGFAALPPQAGEARPTEAARQGETLDVLLAGPDRRSELAADVLQRAGNAVPGIRSSVGDPGTATVAKGRVTQAILAAPEGDGEAAQAMVGRQAATRRRPAVG